MDHELPIKYVVANVKSIGAREFMVRRDYSAILEAQQAPSQEHNDRLKQYNGGKIIRYILKFLLCLETKLNHVTLWQNIS
jgi:hypothetical protein